jgi:expansin (peptidoglycan-binding protein)
LKQRSRQRLEAAQMEFLRTVLGLTALKIRNTEIRGRLNVKKKKDNKMERPNSSSKTGLGSIA